MTSLTPEQRAFLEAPNAGHLAVVLADGSPHVSPVWVDVSGDLVLVNSREGRLKVRRLHRDPRVALSVIDRENSRRGVLIRGRVVEITEEGALEHIEALSRKYEGKPFDGPRDGRVIVKIRPERVRVALE